MTTLTDACCSTCRNDDCDTRCDRCMEPCHLECSRITKESTDRICDACVAELRAKVHPTLTDLTWLDGI